MRQIGQANADALSELYDRYARLVYSLAFKAIGNQQLAEEVVQEVFLQVWKNAGSYRAERAKVTTWLASITRYRSIDTWRRRNSRPESNLQVWSDHIESTGRTDLEHKVEQRLWVERIRVALDDLPKEQRRVLALSYFRGYTHREIAEATGIPLGTVKTRIRLAMQKLRRAFREERSAEG